MSQFSNNFFKYFTLLSFPYITAHNLYYFRYYENKYKYDVLYSTQLFHTLFSYMCFPLVTPLYILHDIPVIEKKLRKIPIDINDICIFSFHDRDYKIKQKFLEKN
jgi:hypothetical protein